MTSGANAIRARNEKARFGEQIFFFHRSTFSQPCLRQQMFLKGARFHSTPILRALLLLDPENSGIMGKGGICGNKDTKEEETGVRHRFPNPSPNVTPNG